MSIQISLTDEAAGLLWRLIKNQLEGSRTPLWTIEEATQMDKVMDGITKDNPKTALCKNNHRTILATGTLTEFQPDAEPYEAEKEEDADVIEDEVRVGVHYCPACEEIVDAWIEYPTGEG